MSKLVSFWIILGSDFCSGSFSGILSDFCTGSFSDILSDFCSGSFSDIISEFWSGSCSGSFSGFCLDSGFKVGMGGGLIDWLKFFFGWGIIIIIRL